MGDEIKFNKNVQTTGIKKADLLNELKNQGIQDNVASTIFEKFNTNTVGIVQMFLIWTNKLVC